MVASYQTTKYGGGEMDDRKQVVTRIPDDLHRKVKIKSAETGKTITEVIKEKLEEWVEDDSAPEDDED